MAVSYHPHDVNFVIIDYKGGGMSDLMEPLPLSAYTNRILHAIPVPRRFEQSQLFKFQDKAADRRIEFLFLPAPCPIHQNRASSEAAVCSFDECRACTSLDGKANYALVFLQQISHVSLSPPGASGRQRRQIVPHRPTWRPGPPGSDPSRHPRRRPEGFP